MQIYVARRQEELSAAVLDSLRLAGGHYDRVEWVAPIESEKFSEPCDGAFLRAIRQPQLRSRLAEFWPSGGPRWDALALLHPGAAPLLVEAKSYPAEIVGGGCKAKPGSRPRIESSLGAA